MSICTTAPPAFRKRTWSARNDSSVCCASMSRSPAAMARRVFLSRSTKWRRDDEPLEPQARCPSRIPAGRGLSVESIMADHVIAARSERAVRCAASRWGLALGIGTRSPSGIGFWRHRLQRAHLGHRLAGDAHAAGQRRITTPIPLKLERPRQAFARASLPARGSCPV